MNDDGTVKVLNRGIFLQDRSLSAVNAKAFVADPNVPAKLKVDFSGPQPNGLVVTQNVLGDYWVLETDYDNYAVVYSCGEVKSNGTSSNSVQHEETTWILTREQGKLASQTRDQIYANLRKQKINPVLFNQVDQINCVYFGEEAISLFANGDASENTQANSQSSNTNQQEASQSQQQQQTNV